MNGRTSFFRRRASGPDGAKQSMRESIPQNYDDGMAVRRLQKA
jgi:hypothetical protein